MKEGKVSSYYYYTLGNSFAMTANLLPSERLVSEEGRVVSVRETERGFYVTVEFDE